MSDLESSSFDNVAIDQSCSSDYASPKNATAWESVRIERIRKDCGRNTTLSNATKALGKHISLIFSRIAGANIENDLDLSSKEKIYRATRKAITERPIMTSFVELDDIYSSHLKIISSKDNTHQMSLLTDPEHKIIAELSNWHGEKTQPSSARVCGTASNTLNIGYCTSLPLAGAQTTRDGTSLSLAGADGTSLSLAGAWTTQQSRYTATSPWHSPASMALNFRHDSRFRSLRKKITKAMAWGVNITSEQRTGKAASILLDGRLDVTLPPLSWNDIGKMLNMVIISGMLATTIFSILTVFFRYRREWWFEFIRGGLLWASPWFALISTTILFLGSDRHPRKNWLLFMNFILVYIIVGIICFLRYYLDLHDLLFVAGLLSAFSSVIICPWIIIKYARLTRLCKFKWMIPQLAVMYSVCSYLLHLIISSMDIQSAMIFCTAIPFVFLLVKACAQKTITKMLKGTVDNKLLVTFFGMLWNVNLEGVKFLSFVALIIQAVKAGWEHGSILLIIGNLMATWFSKIWTLGGLRFLLMPKLIPCWYDYEGEILEKAYYSTRSVTEYSAPLVWMTITIFEGTPARNGLLIPIKADEEKEQLMLEFWNLCYENLYIILFVYVGSGIIFDYMSYRISRLHRRMVSGSVYRVDLPWLLTVLALINGYFLLDTFLTFSKITENLLHKD